MGGKNPLVILDDADMKTAVNCAIQGAYYSTGQRCTASSRFVVTEGIHDRFVEAMKEEMRNIVVDDALKQGTQIGPVVDQSQLEQDMRYVEIAKQEGGTLAFGGEELKRETRGHFMQPVLFTDTTKRCGSTARRCSGRSTWSGAQLRRGAGGGDDTQFGLSSGICTTSLKHASHFKRHAEAGMVMVNLPTAGVDYHVPFGGRKGSSYGPREQGAMRSSSTPRSRPATLPV